MNNNNNRLLEMPDEPPMNLITEIQKLWDLFFGWFPGGSYYRISCRNYDILDARVESEVMEIWQQEGYDINSIKDILQRLALPWQNRWLFLPQDNVKIILLYFEGEGTDVTQDFLHDYGITLTEFIEEFPDFPTIDYVSLKIFISYVLKHKTDRTVKKCQKLDHYMW